MPWQKRFFKGDPVWARIDDHGELKTDSGRVPIKYDRGESKIYHAHPGNLSREDETAEEAWKRQLEEREAELDRREEQLDTREKKLEAREEALREWEETLKSGAVASGPSAESSSASPADAGEDGDAGRKAGTKELFGDISPSELGPAGKIVAVSDQAPPEILNHPGPVDGIIEIHTDGACSGNPGPCGFGFVVRENGNYREMSAFIGRGTNNIAELKAIGVALETLKVRDEPVRLYSDSQYSIGVLTKGWKARANRELILGIRELIAEFEDLQLRKVEGHSGDPLNERADDLATGAVDACK